ncbi:MAG: sugar phosphate isomerase/epimerase family protein [Chthoniobacteraceae bacterium]
MDRRDFIRAGTAAFAGAILPSYARAQEAGKKRSLKKAVNLGMVEGGANVTEKFRMIRDAGFDGVELNRPDGEISVEDIVQAKAATNLEIAGVICTTHWGKPLSHSDPKVREQGYRGLELALKDAGALDCNRLLLVPGVVNKETSYDACWQRSIEQIKRALPVAEAAKCPIAIENVWNNFIMSPLEAVRYIEEIDSPWVGWHFDIGNIITYGWPEQWIRILGPKVLNLHLKDYSRKKRDDEGLWKGFQVELGEGDAGWPDVMKALADIGYQGYGIAEVKGGDATRLKFLARRIDELYAS